MIVLKISDFTGFWSIATNNKTEPTLLEATNLNERAYLDRLLGVELATAFIADLAAGIPQTAIYTTIFNPLTDDCGEHSKGIKNILKGFIYHDYINNAQAFHSQSGVGVNEVDTTAIQSAENGNRFGEIRWNDALESFEIVQRYIKKNIDAYPTYDGKPLSAKFSALL